MLRSIAKLGFIVVASGIVLGLLIQGQIHQAAAAHDADVIWIPDSNIPEFAVAFVAFFCTLFEAVGLDKWCAVSGKTMWISIAASIAISLLIGFVAAFAELESLPPETTRLLVIGTVFGLVGGSVGSGSTQKRYW